jgi:hypothetical protein
MGTALALPLAACDTDSILNVEDPTFASPETLNTLAGLPTLIAGAIGDFQVAYSGPGGDSFLSVVALITDEWYTSDTFPTRGVTDQRSQFSAAQGNTSDPAFTRLQLARQTLRNAADATARLSTTPNDPRRIELTALEGYTFVALAESFCGNIPFSRLTPTGAPDLSPEGFGPGLGTLAVLDSGVVRFDQALAISATSNLAKVGKGRALLGKGQFAAAAAAVAGVPDNFVYNIQHSANSPRQFNPIFSLQDNGRYSVSDREGTNGVDFRSALDPRLPFSGPRPGFDANVPQFINLLHRSFDAPVNMASGVEARLIEAEAALRAGQTTQWLATLNSLRANVATLMAARYPGYAAAVTAARTTPATLPAAERGARAAGFGALAPLTDPGNEAARVDMMFRERAFWLYNTGHRLGDLRRLVRPTSEGGYGRPQNTVFPIGPYIRGGVYGADVTFPIPFNEVNNPEYDAAQCNVRRA